MSCGKRGGQWASTLRPIAGNESVLANSPSRKTGFVVRRLYNSSMNLGTVVSQLKAERDRLKKQVEGISAALAAFGKAYSNGETRPKISAAGRARIAAAQRARWAMQRAKRGKKNVGSMPKPRTLSAAARRKIAAAQRARWARVKAGSKAA
jgi:regulator of protease activity HflC (stomatin/prohibitin superfamily)